VTFGLTLLPTSHVRTANNAMSVDGLCEVGQACVQADGLAGVRACVCTYKHSTQKSVLDRYWTIGLQLIYSTGLVRSTRRWTVHSLMFIQLSGTE